MSAEIASITSALIQGWFALMGSLLGAAALIGTFWFGARSALNAHKADKLAEAKRDVYLELIRKWQIYLTSFNAYKYLDFYKFNDQYFILVKELVASLHKASFISDPNTKEKIMDFVILFSNLLLVINSDINLWYSNPEGPRVPALNRLFAS